MPPRRSSFTGPPTAMEEIAAAVETVEGTEAVVEISWVCMMEASLEAFFFVEIE